MGNFNDYKNKKNVVYHLLQKIHLKKRKRKNGNLLMNKINRCCFFQIMSFGRTAIFAAVSCNRFIKQFKTALPYIVGTATTITYCYVHKPFNKHHAAMLDFFSFNTIFT